jgi:Carboxypeptidase regulatory-like domain
VNTMSLTTGAVGSFTLTGLATPASFSVLVSEPGFASQTLSLSLASGQDLTGISVTLTSGVGSISGTVSTANGAPAGGVTVTASNGQLVLSTVTLSVGAVGTYSLGGLPVPGTYSLTFSAPSLASQTQAVSLTNGAPNATGVNASLVSSTASIFGTVTQTGGTPLPQISILLTSGTTSYQATSATVPTPGAYEVDNITPGTYTISFTRVGGVPTSSIVTLAAGQRLNDNPVLALAASIFGHVVSKVQPGQPTSAPLGGVQVTLYLTTQFPTVSITSVTTDANGNFTIANVEAPQSFVVSFAFPPGTALQSTSLVTTALGVASPICGAHPSPTCNPQADPVVVSTQ